MDTVKAIADSVNGIIWNTPEQLPILVALLLGVGLYVTFRLRFVQFRHLRHAFAVIRGHYDDPKDAGDINHFQALSAALSATIGVGNIAGVATAIHYGGPGALFWMWLTALIGMASKYVECTLSLRYRRINADGSASGGPMYYIERGLGARWKPLAVLFSVTAIISSFGSGNGVQAFTVADSFRTDFGVPQWITGLVSATLVGLVILGGIKRIGAVASRVVPFMSVLYVTGGLLILILHLDAIPDALATIVSEAFTPRGGVGGFAGSTFTFTLMWGVKRGLFSNEAGQGSAPIAHAAAKTNEPVREGMVAMMGPLIDTLVICTITGLAIVTTGVWQDKHADELHFTGSSGVTVLAPDAGVGEKGELSDGAAFTGDLRVDDGYVVASVHFARNDAVVDDARLYAHDAPFTGVLRVDGDGHPAAAWVESEGAPVPLDTVSLSGEMALNGSPMTAAAFQRGLSPLFDWGNLLVTIGVGLFALSTAIAWSYYGDRCVEYLIGPRAVVPYRILFTIVHFFGAVFSLEVVWSFADAALGLMALPNLIAMVLLVGTVVRLTKDYQSRSHKRFQTKAR